MYFHGTFLLLFATVPVLRAQSKVGFKCGLGEFKCKSEDVCISSESICNSKNDCNDRSDEENCGPKKSFATPVSVTSNITTITTKCSWSELQCSDGKCIPTENICNNVRDCSDGWDEMHCDPKPTSTVRYTTEAFNIQQNLTRIPGKCKKGEWQCEDGACIAGSGICNGFDECDDRTGEIQAVCSNFTPPKHTKPIELSAKCTLPPYPINGKYRVVNGPSSRPGQLSDLYVLNVTCNPGYGVVGDSQVFCAEGIWSPSETLPECRRLCKVIRHPSVEHACRFTIGGSIGSRPCEDFEPPGTIAWPECVRPHYFFLGELPTMRCGEDGNWDNNPTCTPDCGQVTPEGAELIIGGRRAKKGELPWHVGIYRKTTTPYLQICGGSIVRPNIVISAAHCFWHDDKALPAQNFAVAAGKVYRPWDDPHDDAQMANVLSIHIPLRFRGASANFMEDLAVLKLGTSFLYQPHIRPVCLDFEENFDHFQLAEGVLGKVAGWGLTAVYGPESQALKVAELPIVSFSVCFNEAPASFRAYITGDKICAGYKNNGTAVCKGDSGGGLVIAQYERGTYRYYLRGVVSTAPNDENLCNANTITTFTHVRRHARFIKNYL